MARANSHCRLTTEKETSKETSIDRLIEIIEIAWFVIFDDCVRLSHPFG